MLNILRNKIFRIFFIEPQFRMRAELFFIFFVIFMIQLGILYSQEKKLSTLRDQKLLVVRIGEMERVTSAKNTRKAAQQAPRGRQYNLTGTMINNGVPYAMIDDLVYGVGDVIGDFTVLSIANDTVLLENKATTQTMTLFLVYGSNPPKKEK